MKKKFHSNGKLLISGEYAILDGALGLAIPTSYGQSLSLLPTTTKTVEWRSVDSRGAVWFTARFALGTLDILHSSQQAMALTLQGLLLEAQRQNPLFLRDSTGFEVETKLDFPINWGLGSSSTLIDGLAQWARADPYQLLWNAFGGSGYDIACARHNGPITYRLVAGKPEVTPIPFEPLFADFLYFVHLNQKQSSKAAIAAYRSLGAARENLVGDITQITQSMVQAQTLAEFEALMEEHERLLALVLGMAPIKGQLFPDYPGTIKSLGAWGGDFVLATGDPGTRAYFGSKGYPTVIPYAKMIL